MMYLLNNRGQAFCGLKQDLGMMKTCKAYEMFWLFDMQATLYDKMTQQDHFRQILSNILSV